MWITMWLFKPAILQYIHDMTCMLSCSDEGHKTETLACLVAWQKYTGETEIWLFPWNFELDWHILDYVCQRFPRGGTVDVLSQIYIIIWCPSKRCFFKPNLKTHCLYIHTNYIDYLNTLHMLHCFIPLLCFSILSRFIFVILILYKHRDPLLNLYNT